MATGDSLVVALFVNVRLTVGLDDFTGLFLP